MCRCVYFPDYCTLFKAGLKRSNFRVPNKPRCLQFQFPVGLVPCNDYTVKVLLAVILAPAMLHISVKATSDKVVLLIILQQDLFG